MSESVNTLLKLASAFVGVKGAVKFLFIALFVAFVPKFGWVINLIDGLSAIQSEAVQLGIGFAFGVLVSESIWFLGEMVKSATDKKSKEKELERAAREKEQRDNKLLSDRYDVIKNDAEFYLPTNSYVELQTLLRLKESPSVTVNSGYCDKLLQYDIVRVRRKLRGNSTLDLEIEIPEEIRPAVMDTLDNYLLRKVELFLTIDRVHIEKLKLLFSVKTESTRRMEVFQEVREWDLIENVSITTGDFDRPIKREGRMGEVAFYINPIFKDAVETFMGEQLVTKVAKTDNEIRTVV